MSVGIHSSPCYDCVYMYICVWVMGIFLSLFPEELVPGGSGAPSGTWENDIHLLENMYIVYHRPLCHLFIACIHFIHVQMYLYMYTCLYTI